MARSTLPLPSKPFIVRVINAARTVVFRTRHLPPGQRTTALYDEELDERHERPFVDLVVGWDLDKPTLQLSHVEGGEDYQRGPGYSDYYHIRVRIPQTEDCGDTAQEFHQADRELAQDILDHFLKRLNGCHPEERKFKPRDRQYLAPYQ